MFCELNTRAICHPIVLTIQEKSLFCSLLCHIFTSVRLTYYTTDHVYVGFHFELVYHFLKYKERRERVNYKPLTSNRD